LDRVSGVKKAIKESKVLYNYYSMEKINNYLFVDSNIFNNKHIKL